MVTVELGTVKSRVAVHKREEGERKREAERDREAERGRERKREAVTVTESHCAGNDNHLILNLENSATCTSLTGLG